MCICTNINLQPFTSHFPCANIHEMLTPDLLHQLIKGTFKDHLVLWIGEYLVLEHGEAWANDILDDIDHQIATAPLFPNLCRFPHGRCFKQWMGDDSKALMKVYPFHIIDSYFAHVFEGVSFCNHWTCFLGNGSSNQCFHRYLLSHMAF